MSINNKYENQFEDNSKKNIFRKSTLTRICIGIFATTSLSTLYSLAHSKYRNYGFGFVKNWIKGSLVFSSSFYVSNEIAFSLCKFYGIYTNFWINYTLIGYALSKVHYRYLIRNHIMKWYIAIKYSHKCFVYFVVLNMIIEMYVYIMREIYLYSENDIVDIFIQKYFDQQTNKPSYAMTFDDIENNFMKSFHIFNSQTKLNEIKSFIKTNKKHNDKNVLGTVNLFEYYKNYKK